MKLRHFGQASSEIILGFISLQIDPFPASFFFMFIFSMQLTENKKCYRLDWNCKSLVLEATTVPTGPNQRFIVTHLS